ncbi:MAG: hypothetical protein K8R46_01755, partial [Pirellulales bacterium]|nr:hypothetical protein [Pirellulales bacterium]
MFPRSAWEHTARTLRVRAVDSASITRWLRDGRGASKQCVPMQSMGTRICGYSHRSPAGSSLG